MQFFAMLRRHTDLHRRWRHEGRLAGLLGGVQFRWDGQDFASGALDTEAVAGIKDNRYVVLEVATNHADIEAMTPVPALPPAPPPPPAKPAEPAEPPPVLNRPPAPPAPPLPPRNEWAPPQNKIGKRKV